MSWLDDQFQAVLRAGAPGVVVVANGPGLSWEQAAGVSDLETGAPMTLEHRFRIASVTKLFVAAVVLQLVDEGAFELDGEVGLIEGGVTVRRILDPLGLADTDLPELSSSPARLARGYLPADNPVLPGPGPDPVDVSEVEPFGWGGGGMVSSARDVARFLRALLGGELLAPGMSAEMFRTVPSGWEESDGYGLGIEEVTSLWGIEQSTCGSAWGHFGFALGYTTIALGSRNGDRQVVVMFNTHPMSEETWAVLGRLVWACLCG